MDGPKKTFVELRRLYNLQGAQRARTEARSTAAVLYAGDNKRQQGQVQIHGVASKATHGSGGPESGSGGNAKVKGIAKIKCHKCKKLGHMKRHCPENKGKV